MKEIAIVSKSTSTSLYDDELGHYEIITEGYDDIVIIKNYKYKRIKKSKVKKLNNEENSCIIEEIENCEKYIVKPLDTLKSISNKFNRSEDHIKEKNKLNTNKLFIGQILNI